MKTLIEMYLTELNKQPENKPSLNDILFISAFPNTNIQKKSREIKRGAEDTLDDFYFKWKERVKADIQPLLDANMPPEMIIPAITFLTRTEFQEIMEGIDTYLPGDTPEILALKIVELQSHYMTCIRQVGTILEDMYSQHQANKQRSQIIQPNNKLIIP